MAGLPRRWNDWLALLILVGVPALWIVAPTNETVNGATIAGWTLVVQFYFRKTPGGS